MNLISPGEYEKLALAVKMEPSGKVIAPSLRDSQLEQKVTLPETPTVGEVIGLAVAGDHGCILRFEVQATKGSGRIVPLGSIQKVMRESIEAAAQYVKAKHENLGITAEWRQSYDVAILGTFMGVPKEGPSAGVALVTGIVSVLKGLKVRNDLAMTGEITILGKVLPVGGIQQKLLAAYESGIKEVLIPADNVSDIHHGPEEEAVSKFFGDLFDFRIDALFFVRDQVEPRIARTDAQRVPPVLAGAPTHGADPVDPVPRSTTANRKPTCRTLCMHNPEASLKPHSAFGIPRRMRA